MRSVNGLLIGADMPETYYQCFFLCVATCNFKCYLKLIFVWCVIQFLSLLLVFVCVGVCISMNANANFARSEFQEPARQIKLGMLSCYAKKE